MAGVLLGRVESSEEGSVSSPLSTVQDTNGLKLKRFKALGVLRISLGSVKASLGCGVWVWMGWLNLPQLGSKARWRYNPLVLSCPSLSSNDTSNAFWTL